jgi:hypothetical protein
MTKRLVTLAAAAVVLLGLTVPAQAQAPATTTTPTFELGAGYTLLRAGEICDDGVLTEVCVPDRTFPFGLAVDAARNFGALGIVGEVGWSYDSEDDASFHVWTFAAGPRWTGRGNPRIWPYGQVLLGAAVTRLSTDIPGIDSDTSTDFMVQPGVGVNFVAGDGWSVFGQVDYRRVFVGDIDIADPGLGGAPLTVDGAGRNDIRVFLGARMILD